LLEITEVQQEEDLLEIRKLFEQYADSLEINLDFQGFEEELAGLPGEYAPPDGCLLIALWKGQIAGCVGLRKFSSCHLRDEKTLFQTSIQEPGHWQSAL